MPLTSLDHVTVLCANLPRSRKFYADILGMTDGDRPPFNFPGAWLYVGGRPVVHLVGSVNDGSIKATGCFDHVAFDGTDIEEMRARLAKTGIAFEERAVPGRPLRQIFVHDPDGVKIEINFRE